MLRRLCLIVLAVCLAFSFVKNTFGDCKILNAQGCYASGPGYSGCTASAICYGNDCPGGYYRNISLTLYADGPPCSEPVWSFVDIGPYTYGLSGDYEVWGTVSGKILAYGGEVKDCDGSGQTYHQDLACAECEMLDSDPQCYDEDINHAICTTSASCLAFYCPWPAILIVAESGNICPCPALCFANTFRAGPYLQGEASCVSVCWNIEVFGGSGYAACDLSGQDAYGHSPCEPY